MLDHLGQIAIPATVAKGPVYVSAVVTFSLAYDTFDVMDNGNLANASSAQIQIIIVLKGMIKSTSRAHSNSERMGHYP